MSFSVLLILSFCSYGHGFNSKRQLASYAWYDQVVLPTVNFVHQHQLPDHTAVVLTPQYAEQINQRRTESEQIASDYRLARVYPVLIHILSPEPLEQTEAQYQFTLEPVPEYHMMEIRESNYPELPRTYERPRNETRPTELPEFGTKVTTKRPTYSPFGTKSPLEKRVESTNEQ